MKEVVINETYARTLGFGDPNDAVGKMVFNNDQPYAIAGVVSDFYENSFHEAMRPVVIVNWPEWEKSVAVRISEANQVAQTTPSIIAEIQRKYNTIFPGSSFQFDFLNESIAQLYEQERKTARLMDIAVIVSIFISCMGLFGLSMFTVARRTREIGIRKIMGAGNTTIVILLTADFLLPVMLAFAIACPLAWYYMHLWLRDFAYRTTINWWLFGLAGFLGMLLALLTIGYQAVKAARTKPHRQFTLGIEVQIRTCPSF